VSRASQWDLAMIVFYGGRGARDELYNFAHEKEIDKSNFQKSKNIKIKKGK